MNSSDALATATLDVLPLSVAVLASDGEILHTNAAWRAFARENGAETVDHVGHNYLGITEASDDEYARRAAAGIRSVAHGERDRFTLEYPCHSPTERRWYLLEATRFESGGDVRVVVAHVDVTERKLAELAVAATAEELAAERAALDHLVERIQGVLREVTLALVEADSREVVEQSVCDALAGTDPYAVAWICAPTPADTELTPTAWAGGDEPPAVDLAGDSPPAVAYRERSLQVVPDLGDAPASPWRDVALASGYGAAAALPLVGHERCYGVLALLADHPVAFDERERVVLAALGRLVGTAIVAVQSKALLASERAVELRVGIRDPSLYVAALAEGDATASYRGSVTRADGTVVELYAVRGKSADALAVLPDRRADVQTTTVVAEHGDERLVEVVAGDSLVARLAEFGAVTRAIEADDEVRLTAVAPDETDARAIFEWLTDAHAGVELLGHHRRERTARTATEFSADLASELTDRQHEALRKAYAAGFFEWPRAVESEALADSMGVSRPTFHQHLRAAERKVLRELFDGPN